MSTVYVDTKKAISVEELREMEANIEMNAIAVDYANNGASGASHSRCLRAKPEVRRSSWIDETLSQRDIEQQEKGVNHVGAMLTGMGFDGVESLCEKAIEQLRKGVSDVQVG